MKDISLRAYVHGGCCLVEGAGGLDCISPIWLLLPWLYRKASCS